MSSTESIATPAFLHHLLRVRDLNRILYALVNQMHDKPFLSCRKISSVKALLSSAVENPHIALRSMVVERTLCWSGANLDVLDSRYLLLVYVCLVQYLQQ
jgi:hypothetical protein